MVFLPGKLRTPLTAESYKARMDQEYRELKSGRRDPCTICGASLAVGSLRSHLVTQHDVHQSFIDRFRRLSEPVLSVELLVLYWGVGGGGSGCAPGSSPRDARYVT